MAEQRWYYSDQGQQKGPVDLATLRRMAEAGGLDGSTLVWTDGMADWEPASRHVPGVGAPPPPLGAPAMARETGPIQGGYARTEAPTGLDYQRRVGFGEAFGLYWRNYVNFRGRSNRGEFWWAILALILLQVAASILDQIVAPGQESQPLSGLLSLATFLPSLALSVRRLHDLDKTGWWVMAPLAFVVAGVIFLIPMFAAIGQGMTPDFPAAAIVCFAGGALMGLVILVWNCQQGTRGPNRFG